MTITAEVKGGRLLVDTTEGLRLLARLEGKRVSLDVEPWRNTRSAQQNRYYHGVIVAILGEELGYRKNEMRDALNHKFGGTVDEQTGLMRIVGTSELTTAQFEDRMAQIRQWAGEEFRIFIPAPNEYDVTEMRAA